MSRIERNVMIHNEPHEDLGFVGLPKRRYRDDFDEEDPLYLPSTARKVEDDDDDSALLKNLVDDDDDDDDTVEQPFRNQYDDWDDDEDDYDLAPPSTIGKKVRMREILTNECCGDEDDEPLYIPSTERE